MLWAAAEGHWPLCSSDINGHAVLVWASLWTGAQTHTSLSVSLLIGTHTKHVLFAFTFIHLCYDKLRKTITNKKLRKISETMSYLPSNSYCYARIK